VWNKGVYDKWGVTLTDADWEAGDEFERLDEALTGDELQAATNFLKVALLASLTPRRRVGRPSWPPELFRSRLDEAVRATIPPITMGRVAANFVTLDGNKGIEPDSLSRLCREQGVVPPNHE
jgi:hypothetical protein